MRCPAAIVMLAAAVLLMGQGAAAAPAPDPAPSHLGGDLTPEMQARVERTAMSDLCLPANAEEAAKLGNNAVLLISAASLYREELPLLAVYVRQNGRDIPLKRLTVFTPRTENLYGRRFVVQDSFYLVPAAVIRGGGVITVDFNGRKGFSVDDLPTSWEPFMTGLGAPGDPDPAALKTLLKREYPDWFDQDSQHS